MQERVYIFLPDSCSCVFPVGDYAIPWPIVYLLGRHHKKHIFMSRSVPRVSRLADALVDFENRMRWRWCFRNDDGVPPSIRVRGKTTPTYTGSIVDPELSAWLGIVRRQLIQAGCTVASRARSSRRTYCNQIPLVRSALNLMKSLGLKALLNDKDGGFCVIAKPVLYELRRRMLGTDQYEEIDPFFDSNGIARTYSKLCRRIGDFEEEPSLGTQLQKSLSGGTLVGKFVNTMKSHKDPGQVCMRPIHANAGWALAGVAKWVSHRLRRQLDVLVHLVKSSKFFVERISCVKPIGRVLFVKLDLKDYFLSGTPDELIHDIVGPLAGCEKKLVEDCLHLLLSHQYISAEGFDGRLWRSVKGSGMGLLHSGDLMDVAFYLRCEKWFLDCPGKLWSYGIQRYFRYRDDILIVAQSADGVRCFLDEVRSRQKYFRVEIESSSRSSVRFLDCKVSVASGRFVCAPTVKGSALLKPLDVASRHVPHTRMWPLACLSRMHAIANTEEGLMQAKEAFIQRFIHHAAPPALIRLMQEHGQRNLVRKARLSNGAVLWIRLPYHPAWHKDLVRLFGRLSRDASLNSLFCMCFGMPMPALRIAWCNTVSPLLTRVSKA